MSLAVGRATRTGPHAQSQTPDRYAVSAGPLSELPTRQLAQTPPVIVNVTSLVLELTTPAAAVASS